jgi:DinB family protein
MGSSVAVMDLDWNTALAEQLDWQWQNHLRPRLDGLTDDEYFWEPVPGCWSLRRRDASTAPRTAGSGDYVWEFAYPPPEQPPVTTIAWRLAHLITGVFAERNASHFGGPPADLHSFEYAGTASEALDQLDDAYATWIKGVRSLGDAGLIRPCGPAEGPYADYPLAELVLHINREALHHGAEIALLRDLYRWEGTDRHAL